MILRFAISSRVRAPERMILRGGRWAMRALPVRYGILLHPSRGPILIDTGYHPAMMSCPARTMFRLYRRLLPPDFEPGGLPEAALGKLGRTPAEVTDILVTHLHADHVAGLAAFPGSRLHMSSAALTQALAGGGRGRGVFAELIPPDLVRRTTTFPEPEPGATPLGPGRDILGDGSLWAVDLPGHAVGHSGLWIPSAGTLYAADVAWTMAGLMGDREGGLVYRMVTDDRRAAADSAARVRAFAKGGGRVILCHDPDPIPEDLP